MKKEIRLYNILLPIWLLILAPQLLVFLIPGNLVIDCVVLLCTLLALKHAQKAEVLRQLWWKIWLLGFAADGVGVVWMFLGWVLYIPFGDVWGDTVGHIAHNPFAHPAAFVWTLAGVALAGGCIYLFDKAAMRSCVLLSDREKHTAALVLAVVTAPWLFFIPVYG